MSREEGAVGMAHVPLMPPTFPLSIIGLAVFSFSFFFVFQGQHCIELIVNPSPSFDRGEFWDFCDCSDWRMVLWLPRSTVKHIYNLFFVISFPSIQGANRHFQEYALHVYIFCDTQRMYDFEFLYAFKSNALSISQGAPVYRDNKPTRDNRSPQRLLSRDGWKMLQF